MSITLEMIDNIKKLNNDQIAKIIKVESPWAIENKDLAKKVISSHKNIKKKEEKKIGMLIGAYAHLNTHNLITLFNELEKSDMLDVVLDNINKNTKGDIFKLSLYNRIVTLNKIKIFPDLFSEENLKKLEESLDKKNI